MQRNMDLVRTILMRMERSPAGWAPDAFGFQSFSPGEVLYHTHIMAQDGLIEGVVTASEDKGPEAMPQTLTWKGHEFLDLARDQDRWNKAKAIISKVGGAPISVWMKVLTDLTLQVVDTASTKAS